MSADSPEAQPTTPPPSADADKASGGARALAFLLVLALLFGGAVMIVVGLNPDDTPRCEEAIAQGIAGECFDVTKTQQTIQAVLALPAGILAGLAALVGLAVVFTGRHGSLMMRLVVPAVVLGGLAVLIGQF